jgi:hypothetical protein
MKPEYFLTAVDPDYLPKGSRDPLGYQVLWQHQGKKLIPYLSTVSSLVKDFQLMCTSRYLYGDKSESGWSKYFMRFEQLMSYVRVARFPDKGFSGVDRVRKRMQESNRYSISNNPNDEILSNQRSYGIWAKYIRPFVDIKFEQDPELEAIYESKLIPVLSDPIAARILDKLERGERFYVDKESLHTLFAVFEMNSAELAFLRNKLICLESTQAHQNRLHDYIRATKLPKEFELYPFLRNFSNFLRPGEMELKYLLEEHAQTERVLSPTSTVFRYLQTKPLWTKQEIETDDYITNCNQPISYHFNDADEQSKLLNNLASLLGGNNWTLVQALAQRNKEVTDWRGGVAWLQINKDLLEVRHADGGMKKENYDPEKHHENPYFIPTYISLYNQLKGYE